MNRECSLSKRVQTKQGTRYCPVALAANGRAKRDIVIVNGREERHPEGAYYISWYEGRKLHRLSVGKKADVAGAARAAKEAELNARNHGVAVVSVSTNGNGKGTLQSAVTSYLEEIKDTKKPKTLAAYTTSLDYFMQSCHKLHLEEIERKDLLKFSAFLRDQELSPRTVWNKFLNVVTFLKSQGIRGLVQKNDWPQFTEEEPEVYEKEDLEKLLKVCTKEEQLWWDFFLMTGCREQEVMHMMWDDVNLKASTVSVRHKPGWEPKAYKERTIPVPAKLAHSLKDLKARSNGSVLLFPTSGERVKMDFLDELKVCAVRAKLRKENFFLHKFRATFATWHLWSGVDLRTVQEWMGHTDMESTMRYLKPSRSKETHAKVNATFA